MNYSQDGKKRQTNSNKKKKKKKRKKNSIGRVILRIFLILFVVGIFAVGGAFLGAYMGIIENTGSINTADITPGSYNSTIYDQQGNEIDTLHGDENREYVKLEYIPEDLQHAVIAIEDERFYSHSGIDIKGIMRAFVVNIKERNFSQGASTLTQQLIKNNVLNKREKTIIRKIKEQYLAVVYEKEFEKQLGSKEAAKDYILELYLNSISLNHGLYGVEAAAEFYFGKSVSELNLAESACIAGITQNPSKYSPVSHPDFNRERQLTVLQKMLEQGYITQEEYDEAVNDDIYSRIVGKSSEGYTEALHSYFVDALIVEVAEDLVEEKNMTEKQAYDLIYSGGLQITSTVDTNMQNIMEEAYMDDSLFPPKGNTLDVEYTISVKPIDGEEQTHHTKRTTVKTREEAEAFAEQVKAEVLNDTNEMVLDKLTITESLQSAMVIMDYHTGQVKALVGGRGQKPGDLVFNRATDAYRSPGSSFKPLAVYGPAIDMGLLTPNSILIDEPYTINGYSPRNWNGTFLGAVTVREAIRDSMNVVAVKTLVEDVGVDNAYNYLLKFGFTSLVEDDKVPSMALGGLTNGVSVLEMTAAYSAIANDGVYNEPIFYTKILNHDGEVLLEKEPESHTVLKKSTALMLTDMMQDVITGGGSATGRLANFQNMDMHIAGKTGTTNDNKDLTFVGYTPYYCAGIWLGYDIQKSMTYDKSYHLILWREVMEKVHEGLPDKAFERANIPNVSTEEKEEPDKLCTVSGKKAIPGVCELDYFNSGSVVASGDIPSETCDIHKIYRIDTSTGMIANEYCPADSVKSVALAVDGSGNVINSPNGMNVNNVCTTHTADNTPPSDEDLFIPGEENNTENGENQNNNNENNNNTENNNSNNNSNNGNNNNSNNTETTPKPPEPDETIPENTDDGMDDNLFIPS